MLNTNKQKIKRQFYIIGHNPNTIEEAAIYLKNGANGLEPDIVFAEGKYYISHTHHHSYKDIITLQDYLLLLKKMVTKGGYNLALIIWDMKDTNFDLNEFIGIVKENFSGGFCDGVCMLMTHADDYKFISSYQGKFENVGVGVDESNVPPSVLEQVFKNAGLKNYSYADGITTFLKKPGVYKNTREAIQCRFKNGPESFGIIYTWVLSQESSMCDYLDSYVDGIMVDAGEVLQLREIIHTFPYDNFYELARNGHNPFKQAPILKYRLTIKTADNFLAGTDAIFLFTLSGPDGTTLQSLPFKSAKSGAFEKGSTTYVFLEGVNLGSVTNLTIEALRDGIASGWLPKSIMIENNLDDQVVHFTFGKDEWINKQVGKFVKQPD